MPKINFSILWAPIESFIKTFFSGITNAYCVLIFFETVFWTLFDSILNQIVPSPIPIYPINTYLFTFWFQHYFICHYNLVISYHDEDIWCST